MTQNNLCKVCGRFFEAEVSSDYCPSCKTLDDETYESVRKYLLTKPRASIFEVTSQLKIPVKTIKRFLREDRLEIVEADNGFLKCDTCGISIHSGYLCKSCKHGKFSKAHIAEVANDNGDVSNSVSLPGKKSMNYL
jgi:hypothetical protein